jgi:hypothetical protein
MTVLGVGPDRKRRKRFFTDKTRADPYLNEHVHLFVDPLYGRGHEVLFSLARLDPVGILRNEVMEFYPRHGSQQRNPPLHKTVTATLEQKLLIDRGKMCLQRMTVVPA